MKKSQVVHLPEHAYNEARQYCKEHGIQLKAWVSKLIMDEVKKPAQRQAL